jgi:hypothetical protein
MAKAKFDAEAKKELEDYVSRLPKFQKIHTSGVRKGQPAFLIDKKVLSGKELIQKGKTEIESPTGEKSPVDPNNKYVVDTPTAAALFNTFEFFYQKIRRAGGMTSELLSQITDEYYKEMESAGKICREWAEKNKETNPDKE